MADQSTTTGHPTPATILSAAVRLGDVAILSLAEAAESSEDMIYRVLGGQEPKYRPSRNLLRWHPKVPGYVRDQLVACYLRTTEYRPVPANAFDLSLLDVTGDGRVDDRDAACLSLRAVAHLNDVAERIVARGPAECSEAQRDEMLVALYEAQAKVGHAIAAMEHGRPMKMPGSRSA